MYAEVAIGGSMVHRKLDMVSLDALNSKSVLKLIKYTALNQLLKTQHSFDITN